MDRLTINDYLSALMQSHGIRNDAELCRRLYVQPSTICKVRKNRLPLTSFLFCRLHEHLGVEMSEIRAEVDPRFLSRELQEPDEVY